MQLNFFNLFVWFKNTKKTFLRNFRPICRTTEELVIQFLHRGEAMLRNTRNTTCRIDDPNTFCYFGIRLNVLL